MPLVAKENLYAGGICFAAAGSVVSGAAVEKYGWQNKVDSVGEDLPRRRVVPTPRVKIIPHDDPPAA